MKDYTVLVLTNNLGGLYNFRREVIKAIVDGGYRICISVPNTDNVFKGRFKTIGCDIVETHFNGRGINPLSDIRLVVAYYRLLQKTKPYCVLTYTIKPNVYGGMVCRLMRVPYLPNVTGLGDVLRMVGR